MPTSKAKFDENGNLVNSTTGKQIGVRRGNRIVIDSTDSPMFTLEDYGVREPDFPDEMEERGNHKRKETDDDFANAENIPMFPSTDDSSSSSSSSSGQPEPPPEAKPVDKGPTSFSKRKTKYEITKDSYFVVRFGLLQQDDGRFVPIKDDMVDTYPESERHWVKFRMWTYREELSWKAECLEYNTATKSQFLNIDRLNERKVKCLMLDWSFGEYEDSLKLLHCDGRLSDESYSKFMGMYPSIATTIVDMMNAVLENNQ